ncbi:MAG: HAD-IA family hydrolase [Acidimicrobiales bacterium]|jgi:putative hydrolase of the HAD superfamily|nr:HAD-IA family hydrolase [Acidimicrobiales bacterium]MDG1846833.1 HAD-IA family hydrolase [Acidimicrobiales bacterium]
MITTILFDFGGVITTSPFDGFAAYEREIGVPDGLIRKINSTKPNENAWAQFERNEVEKEQFLDLFAQEALALGYEIDPERVLQCLSTEVRPNMVRVLKQLSQTYTTAILTNNLMEVPDTETNLGPSKEHLGSVSAIVHAIIESSKIGVRKPDLTFYEIACDQLNVSPNECVFLDDLGINLKPAKSMGMTTIKVISENQALHDLEHVLSCTLT